MAKLKMVKGQTFGCPPIFGDRIVSRGEVVDVEKPEHVKLLLDETFSDPSNNIHNYFKVVESDEGEDDAGEATEAKPKSRKRATKE